MTVENVCDEMHRPHVGLPLMESPFPLKKRSCKTNGRRNDLLTLARALLKYNRPGDAIPLLNVLVQSDDRDYAAARLLAVAFARKEQWTQAQIVLDTVSGSNASNDDRKPCSTKRLGKAYRAFRNLVLRS